MNLTAIAIVAIICWCIVSIVESFKSKQKQKVSDATTKSLQADIAALQQRIETLEKIVTDEEYELKRKFRDLDNDNVA
jgi:cell division protein FtsB